MFQHTGDRNHGIRSIQNWLRQLWSLHTLLWISWVLAVVGTACFSWHHDHVAHLPTNMIALVLHALLIGLIGLIIITYIEIRADSRSS